MDKRALCAFDNKRILLEDGIHTLAIGHKDVTANVEQDRIENPRADEVFPEKIARDMGLFWTRRKGATNRAGIDLTVRREKNYDIAIAAGHTARNNIRQMVDQVPDFPDRYNPLEARPSKSTKQKSHPNHCHSQPKRQRCEILSDSDEESSQSSSQNVCHKTQPSIHFQRGLARIDSQASEADGRSASARSSPEIRKRRNSFVDDEAGEGDASGSESESHRTSSIAPADHTSDSPSDYDADSSDSDLDFVVGDDCFD